MKSSSTLGDSALAYAQTLVASGGNIVRSKTAYGENLWYVDESSNLSLAKCARNQFFFILRFFGLN